MRFILYAYYINNNPPVQRVVFRLPYKGLWLHKPLKGHVKNLTTAYNYLLPLDERLLFLGLLERILIFFWSQIIFFHIFEFLISYVFSYNFIFQSYRGYKIPFGPKIPIAIFVLQIRMSFKYPINDDTANLGGIITNIWSFIACASIISTSLYSHSVLKIFPISLFICPYISFLLYFGINTIWYLQFHLVCGKLESSFGFVPFDYLLYFVFGCQTNYII